MRISALKKNIMEIYANFARKDLEGNQRLLNAISAQKILKYI